MFEPVDLGSLPDDRSAATVGALQGAFTDGWFSYEDDDVDERTTLFRIRAADPASCVPYTIAITDDETYTCNKANDPSAQFSSDAPALSLGLQGGNTDIGLSEDTDFWKDTLPAGAVRHYVLRTIQGVELFGLSTEDGLLSGFYETDAPAPVTVGVANDDTGTSELFVRVDTDFALVGDKFTMSNPCVPYTLEVYDSLP